PVSRSIVDRITAGIVSLTSNADAFARRQIGGELPGLAALGRWLADRSRTGGGIAIATRPAPAFRRAIIADDGNIDRREHRQGRRDQTGSNQHGREKGFQVSTPLKIENATASVVNAADESSPATEFTNSPGRDQQATSCNLS